MPGLIDAHYHCMFAIIPEMAALTKDFGFVVLMAAANARNTLLRGFTSVRDMGGPIFGLKDAIDAGITPDRVSGLLAHLSVKRAVMAISGCLTRYPKPAANR